MHSGDVQPARKHKDIILDMNCEFDTYNIIRVIKMFVQVPYVHSAFTIEGGRVTVSRDDNSDTLKYNHAR